MKSGSISALEEEIFNFGHAFRFMPQAWILTSEVSLNTIRSELMQKLGKLDTLIIVDTTHDKAAWFNFGPEADTKMRRLWQRDAAAGQEFRLIRKRRRRKPIRKSLMLRPRIYPQHPAKDDTLNASVVIRLGVGVQHRTVDLRVRGSCPTIRGRFGPPLPRHTLSRTTFIFTWSRYGKALAAFEVP